MRRFFRQRLAAAALGLLAAGAAPAAAAPPLVVVSVAPLHSLAASVTEGVSVPYLLVRGAASPHGYALTPSDSRALSEAGLIVWVGAGLEGFLKKPLATLGARAHTLELEELASIDRLPRRRGGAWDEGHVSGPAGRDAAHGKAGHDHGADDPHLWLSTRNAEAILGEIAAALSRLDPGNRRLYAGNAGRATARIAALRSEIDTMLRPVRARPFIVFHDAWQYFEKEFALSGAGAISVSPDRKPGARRLVEIRRRIEEARVRCVFAEPQFSPALVDTVIRGTAARSAVLDPLGAGLVPGPGLYEALMRNLAAGLVSCLRPAVR